MGIQLIWDPRNDDGSAVTLAYNPYGDQPTYVEQLGALAGGYGRPGGLWGTPDGLVHFFGSLRLDAGASGGAFRHWLCDGLTGKLANRPKTIAATWWAQGGVYVAQDYYYTADPNGMLYRWSPVRDAEPVVVNLSLSGTSTMGMATGVSAWSYGAGGAVTIASFGLSGTRCQDFAISTAEDRVWIQTPSFTDFSQVNCYKLSDRSFVATIWAPNQTAGILPTGDGFVWLFDTYGWFVLYDINGNYRGRMRHSFEAAPYGRALGWDRAVKRFLELTVTADASAGVSTLHLRGFYPVPQPVYVTKAYPRLPIRANESNEIWAHLCGAGGEPVSSRLVQTGASVALGLPQRNLLSDDQGDVTTQISPITTGSQDINLTVIDA